MFDLNTPLKRIVLTYDNGKCIQLTEENAIEFQTKMREIMTVYVTQILEDKPMFNLDIFEWEVIRNEHKEVICQQQI